MTFYSWSFKKRPDSLGSLFVLAAFAVGRIAYYIDFHLTRHKSSRSKLTTFFGLHNTLARRVVCHMLCLLRCRFTMRMRPKLRRVRLDVPRHMVYGGDCISAITRKELAVMILRFAEAFVIELSQFRTEMDFTGIDKIADYLLVVVNVPYQACVNGKAVGAFDPVGNVTRAWVATVFQRPVALPAVFFIVPKLISTTKGGKHNTHKPYIIIQFDAQNNARKNQGIAMDFCCFVDGIRRLCRGIF